MHRTYIFATAFKKYSNVPALKILHGLRHTACTRLIELDVPLDVVKDIMRHSNINITLEVYNHIKHERKREAIERLSNY